MTMTRPATVTFVPRLAFAALLATAASSVRLYADGAITPHPVVEKTTDAVTKQLGNFGESFVDAGFRARGFDVIDGNIGVNGIDRIAVKRAATGQLVDIRFVEVKTRQTVPVFKLAATKNNGPQLSQPWTRHNLSRIARDHPDANARRLAREILKRVKDRPEIVRRELHGIVVESNKYVVMTVDDAGRVTGVAAEGRLTSLLKMLANRGTSEETRAAAMRHLSQFDQLKSAVAKAGIRPTAITKTSAQGLEGIAKQLKLPVTRHLTASQTTVIVEDLKAAKYWAATRAKYPGVLAVGITFAVDEAFTSWDYHVGSIGSAGFQRQTAENVIKASTVALATQLLYIVAPTPHGLLLIGVAIVAYIAADQAISVYDDAFAPKSPVAAELKGIIPAAYISTPMLNDVASGQDRKAILQQ